MSDLGGTTTSENPVAAADDVAGAPADGEGERAERPADRSNGRTRPGALHHLRRTLARGTQRARSIRPAALLPFTPLLVLAWQAWDRRWITDDGFINFRVVDMVLAGHGPVFNVGERVETTTSVLWLWTLVVGDVVLPFDLEWVAVLLGLGLTLLGLGLAVAASVRLWRGTGTTTPLVPAGAWGLAVLPPVWDFATSGLEGGLTFAWIGAVAWVLARWGTDPDHRRLGLPAAVLVGLGPLVRPDMAILTGLALVGVLAAQWRTSGWRSRAALVGAAAAIPVAYQIFRMGFFAALVPNTALAKNADGARWTTGWFYLRDLLGTYALWLPLLALAVVVGVPLLRRTGARLRPLVGVATVPLAGVLIAVYVVRVGGDYLHARLLLPAVWALLAPVGVAPLPLRLPWSRRDEATAATAARTVGVERWACAGGLVVVAVWAVVCAGWLRHPGHRVDPERHGLVVDGRASLVASLRIDHPVTAASQGWGPGSPTANPAPADVYLNGVPTTVEPADGLRTPAYAAYGIGITGYALGPGYYMVDMLGLADPVESRMVATHTGLPGHEKPMPTAWLMARVAGGPIDPDIPLPQPLPFVGLLYESPAGELDADVAAASRALACPRLQELLEAVRAPLTAGRFLDNLRAAPRLTGIEIPADPQEAERALC
jgi:arabinofuranosyltransferase